LVPQTPEDEQTITCIYLTEIIEHVGRTKTGRKQVEMNPNNNETISFNIKNINIKNNYSHQRTSFQIGFKAN